LAKNSVSCCYDDKNNEDFQNVNETKRNKNNLYINEHFLHNQTKIKNDIDFIVYGNDQIMKILNDGKNVIFDIKQNIFLILN